MCSFVIVALCKHNFINMKFDVLSLIQRSFKKYGSIKLNKYEGKLY